jgi:hypothetical protein
LRNPPAARLFFAAAGGLSVDLDQWKEASQRPNVGKIALEGVMLMVFEPEPDDVARQQSHSKRYDRVIGLLWILGTVGAIVVLIYLFGFLD